MATCHLFLFPQVLAVRPLQRPGAVQPDTGAGDASGCSGSGGVLMFVWDGTDARPLAPGCALQ